MRLRYRTALLVALLACVGAAPPKKKTESRARKAATKRATELVATLAKRKVSGFVVANHRAFSSKQAARASKDAPAGGTAIDASSVQGDHGGQVWKVISDQGDLVEVRSTHGDIGQHCHRESASDPVEVRAFVRKVDLRPVLATEQFERFRDGSGIRFSPGAAVGAPIFAPRGGWAVYAEGVTFELRVPDEAIALSYPAPKPFAFTKRRLSTETGPDGERAEPRWRRVVPLSVLYLDGRAALRADSLPEDMTEVQSSEGSSRPQEELLELASKCVKLKIVGSAEDGPESGGLKIAGSRARWTSTHRIPKGTPLTYPDGSPAGTTLAEVFGEAPTRDEDRLCFDLAVALESRLCASSSAVIEDK